jgi:pimeloyl-ACP methyl ester carboxylesterase
MAAQILKLADGRNLGFGVYANPRGVPVMHFHGTPGSQLEAALIAEYLGSDAVCLIGMDRPGYGRSSMKPGWTIGDIPGDVEALANHLGYDRFIVTGYSGGGPYVTACALKIPQRLLAAGIISGVGPAEVGSAGMHAANRKKFNLAQQMPWLVKWMIRMAFSSLRGRPEKMARQIARGRPDMPAIDHHVLGDRHFLDWMVRETMEAVALGSAGLAHEEVLFAFPWGFRLEDIRCANVFLWHGCLDRNVPLSMARAVAERIPGCQAQFFPDDGHLSLIYRHGKEIFEELIECARSNGSHDSHV